MGRPRTFDIEEAVDAATKLFWQKGYDKTSLSDLTETLNIAPASFYFAFESKERLFREVVDRYIVFLNEAFERAFQSSTTGVAVEALLRGYIDVVTDAAHAPGCLVINSMPSTNSGDPIKQWLADHREALRARLVDRFSADRASGKLPKSSDPQAMARFVVTLAAGLAVEARSGGTRRELYAMLDIALMNFPGREDRASSTVDTGDNSRKTTK